MKLIGYCEMKKKKGKILFVTDANDYVTGLSCDRLFLFGDVSDDVTPSRVGKDFTPVWSRGSDGKAYVSSLTF